MIGLEANKFKALITSRLQDYGVLLDEEKDDELSGNSGQLTFIGMGNKRKATVDVPDDLTDDNLTDKVDEAAGIVRQRMIGGV